MTSTKSQPADVASDVPDAATDLPETALDQIQGGQTQFPITLNYEEFKSRSAPASGQPAGQSRTSDIGLPVVGPK